MFSKVVFTDEKPGYLVREDARYGESGPTYHKAKYPLKFKYWGGISYNGKTSLVISKGRPKSADYISTLSTAPIPFAGANMPRRWRLLQGKYTTHTSRETN